MCVAAGLAQKTQPQTMKLLQLLRPLMLAIPEVAQPDRPVQFQEKATWTFVSVLVFLICSQLPLYGARETLNVDPFYRLRTMLGSTHGSLMELGVFPVLVSGLLMQVLASTKVMQVNMNSKEERALFTGAQKVFSLVGGSQCLVFVHRQKFAYIKCMLLAPTSAAVHHHHRCCRFCIGRLLRKCRRDWHHQCSIDCRAAGVCWCADDHA